MDRPISLNELPFFDKKAQTTSGFSTGINPGNGPHPRSQYDTNSCVILFHCIDEIAKDLSDLCRKSRAEGSFSMKKIQTDITTSINTSIQTRKLDTKAWEEQVVSHPKYDSSKDTKKLSSFVMSKLIQYLALFGIIPFEMYYLANVQNDKKGPVTAIKLLSTKIFPDFEKGSVVSKLNKTIKTITSQLNDIFDIPASDAFTENILCKIADMISSTVGKGFLDDEEDKVSNPKWQVFALELVEKRTTCKEFLNKWISNASAKDFHHFDIHLNQYYHLFYVHPKQKVLKMRHSCNSKTVKLGFVYDSDGHLTIEVNPKSTENEEDDLSSHQTKKKLSMNDFFPFSTRFDEHFKAVASQSNHVTNNRANESDDYNESDASVKSSPMSARSLRYKKYEKRKFADTNGHVDQNPSATTKRVKVLRGKSIKKVTTSILLAKSSNRRLPKLRLRNSKTKK